MTHPHPSQSPETARQMRKAAYARAAKKRVEWEAAEAADQKEEAARNAAFHADLEEAGLSVLDL